MSPDQLTAFQTNGGFSPAECAALFYGFTFAVLLLWGVWAMRTAYIGWTDSHLSGGQFVSVIVRFVAMYLVLTYLLLS